ncbi:transglycosylase SLT domain-containing protein [Ornithinibacillus sp. L9]|uniref:Transglycosylase SLT domain-containing protein n=1 Tax=Ornithinibacillus caprae TaxID=2678566 RepID=A0A6N8FGD8_9BACI|nr:lysozyme family protein [Ornithinibacillus caprae]MUK88732.1 transglycosylase SLT domain-containing protein [Ornithinibacillus caprae]
MKKRTKVALKQSILVTVFLISIFVIISYLSYEPPSKVEVDYPSISREVLDYQPLVEKYAREYSVSNYVDVLLAMMMQESGGRGNDPMQSSESYCGAVGCIDDPELSIKQGVYYFSQTLDAANGDLELAIQSYNFGKGFIDYVLEHSQSYSQDIAIDFSKHMYENAPDQSIYSCLREEAKQYNACYGDIYYVKSVMTYKEVISAN